MNNFKKTVLGIFLLTLVILPVYAFAETAPSEETKKTEQREEGKTNQNQAEKITGPGTSADQPLIECGGVDKNGTPQPECTLGDLNQLVQSLLNLVFMFGGLIVAGMFMYAGFLLITSVGDTAKIQKAKEIFRRVVIGFLIMFLAYLIIKNLLDKLDLDSDVKPLFDKLFK